MARGLLGVQLAISDAHPDYAFPAEHWPKLRSTNSLERFNREIARRTDMVGIFPDDASVIGQVTPGSISARMGAGSRR